MSIEYVTIPVELREQAILKRIRNVQRVIRKLRNGNNLERNDPVTSNGRIFKYPDGTVVHRQSPAGHWTIQTNSGCAFYVAEKKRRVNGEIHKTESSLAWVIDGKHVCPSTPLSKCLGDEYLPMY